MDQYKFLVIIKGEDKTKDIEKYSFEGNKANVKFKNNEKVYSYFSNNIQFFSNPVEIDIQNTRIEVVNEGELFNVLMALNFNEYYKFFHENGETQVFHKSKVKLFKNFGFSRTPSVDLFQYFKSVSENVSLVVDDGTKLLTEEYNKINFLERGTVLSKYLNYKKNNDKDSFSDKTLIFPFGANASQIKAVKNAMNSQISIIEGPPGTGKTQTILNIIANIIMENKTVAVVSNNNSAAENVYEKMCKNDLGFICAVLGKRDNKTEFVSKQEEGYPDIREEDFDNEMTTNETKRLVDSLVEQFEIDNRIQKLRSELQELQLEKQYYISENEDAEIIPKTRENVDTAKLLRLKLECDERFFDKKRVSIFFKLKAIFWYGIGDRNFYKQIPSKISKQYNNAFYHIKDKELNNMLKRDSQILKYKDFDNAKQMLTELSMKLLKKKICDKYDLKSERKQFSIDDMIHNNESFINEYPVIMSTTHSIKNCLGKDFLYDYVIVDEASQVDLVTGVLALSCAKNIIVVGDLKQLPNVIEEDKKIHLEKLAEKYDIPFEYDYSRNSFLSSIHGVFKDAPSTLLKEHYRCHPKIIGFCNKKFYNNQLVIMTKDKNEGDVLKAVKTVIGNHARGHLNQRQIDEITMNILPDLQKTLDNDNIGIVSPYREQKEAMKFNSIEVDTIHKFQGREKDAIILTTVDNKISEFVDNPNMLNVAVSRAKRYLRLVVSNNDENDNSNIGDLIRYIKYNNFEVVQGIVHSVYDMLYKDNEKAREAYLAKHKRISEFDSENLTQALIEEIFEEEEFGMLNVTNHVELRHIIKNNKELTSEEWDYISNKNTHLDFLIYRKMDKSIVLAIEVDGYSYHNQKYLQLKRDRKKDSILRKSNIELLRLNTIGSGEKERIISSLRNVLNIDKSILLFDINNPQ